MLLLLKFMVDMFGLVARKPLLVVVEKLVVGKEVGWLLDGNKRW